jgi:hypothetical protein
LWLAVFSDCPVEQARDAPAGKAGCGLQHQTCRVKLSITPRTRMRCPADVTSLAKSKAHS